MIDQSTFIDLPDVEVPVPGIIEVSFKLTLCA